MCSGRSSNGPAPHRRARGRWSSSAPARSRRASMRCHRCRSGWLGRSAARPSGTHRGHGGLIGLACTYPHRPLDRDDEDLPVADLAGAGAVADRLNRRLHEVVRDADLEADLVGHLDLDGAATVGLDAVELTTVALNSAHRDSTDLGSIERLEHVVRALGTHDPDHKLHDAHPSLRTKTTAPAAAKRGTYRRPATDASLPKPASRRLATWLIRPTRASCASSRRRSRSAIGSSPNRP